MSFCIPVKSLILKKKQGEKDFLKKKNQILFFWNLKNKRYTYKKKTKWFTSPVFWTAVSLREILSGYLSFTTTSKRTI